jgi:leishmanolysin
MIFQNKVLLLLLSLLFASSLAHFDDDVPCHHDLVDHEYIDELIDVEENTASMEGGKDRILADATPFRIYPYYEFLNSASSSWSSYIRNELAPPVIDYFQSALKVKYALTSNLKTTSSRICEQSIPSILKSPGVPADFFMYYAINSASGYVASATYCSSASGTRRPIIGRTNINNGRMSLPNGNVLAHEKNMYVIMHEMVHALGFSTYVFRYWLDANGKTRQGHVKSVSIGGKTRSVIDVPELTERFRNFYGCSSAPGAIMEDQGGSGTSLSHFERKYFVYETMSSGSINGRRISEFTLGMLEGSGWYVADYSYAEPFFYGQGQGCNFLSHRCGNSGFSEYCTGTTSERGCAPHGRGGGSCNSDSIMDGCRFYYPFESNDCDNDDGADNARLPSLQVFGRGAGSRCFTGTLNTRQSSSGRTTFCFKYECVGSGSDTQLEVQVGQNKIICTQEGTKTIDGYYGAVNCPDPLEFCNGPGKKFCPRGCMGRGECVNGKCECRSGYSGVDCALRA